MAAQGNLKVGTINGGAIGVKNAIINGNFGINQRGVSGTVTLSAGEYGHDRWKAGASGCTYTFATSENVTTLTITAGSLIQVVEDINLLTDTYTLSWTGTAQGKIGAGSFGGSDITGSVTGGTNLNIEFNTGTVSKVQLERGTVATPFDFRSIGQEFRLCQRYYETLPANLQLPYINVAGVSTRSTHVLFKTIKRATPTVTVVGTSEYIPNTSGGTIFSPSFSTISKEGFRVDGPAVNFGMFVVPYTVGTNDGIKISAEL